LFVDEQDHDWGKLVSNLYVVCVGAVVVAQHIMSGI